MLKVGLMKLALYSKEIFSKRNVYLIGKRKDGIRSLRLCTFFNEDNSNH